jgi:hypothetical protein
MSLSTFRKLFEKGRLKYGDLVDFIWKGEFWEGRVNKVDINDIYVDLDETYKKQYERMGGTYPVIITYDMIDAAENWTFDD